VSTLSFADIQVLLAESDNELQHSLFSTYMIIQDNLQLSTKKSKFMALYGKQPIRSNIVMNDQPIDQVESFTFLGCKLMQWTGDINWKIARFNYMCGTSRRTIKGKATLE
jgi:hypothetical protein